MVDLIAVFVVNGLKEGNAPADTCYCFSLHFWVQHKLGTLSPFVFFRKLKPIPLT